MENRFRYPAAAVYTLTAALFPLNLPVLISMAGLKLLRQMLSCAAMLKAYLSPHSRLLSTCEVLVVLYSEGGDVLPILSVRKM